MHSIPPAHSLSNVKHPALSWPGRSRGPTAGPGWDDQAHLPSPRPLPTSLPRTILTRYGLCNIQNPCPQDPSFKVKTQALPAADGPTSGRLGCSTLALAPAGKGWEPHSFLQEERCAWPARALSFGSKGPGKVPTRASPVPLWEGAARACCSGAAGEGGSSASRSSAPPGSPSSPGDGRVQEGFEEAARRAFPGSIRGALSAGVLQRVNPAGDRAGGAGTGGAPSPRLA